MIMNKYFLYALFLGSFFACDNRQNIYYKWSAKSDRISKTYHENGAISQVMFNNGASYGLFMRFSPKGELLHEGIVCFNDQFLKKILYNHTDNKYYLKVYNNINIKDGLVETYVVFKENEKLEIDLSISSYVWVEGKGGKIDIQGYFYFNPDSIAIKDGANILYTSSDIMDDKISLDLVFEQEYQFKFIKNIFGGFDEYQILFDTDVGHLNSNDLVAANKLKKMIDADEIKSIMNEYEVFKK